LCVDNEHFDRLARHHQAREVLETNVVHRAVATDRDDRRTQVELLVVELLPVEVGEEFIVYRWLVLVFQLEFGNANRLEPFRHLRHVAFEHAHCK